MSNGYLTSCALIISIIITVVLFSKQTINNVETKIFKKMLIFNVLESFSTTLIVFVALTNNSIIMFKLLNRIDVNIILWWCSFFLLYIAYVCKIKELKKINYFIIIVNIIFLILSLFLNVNIIAQDGILNSNGPLTTLGLIGAVIYILLMLLIILLSLNKKPDIKKFLPFYFLITLLILIAFLRIIIPEINFISIMITLVDLIMIFTIENPDVKLLEKIEMNRKIIERNNEEKSNLLFKISQDVRVPIKNIEIDSLNMLSLKKKDDLIEIAKKINNESKHLSFIIDNLLDISTMDINKIKLYKTKIDIYNLLTEFNLLVKNKIDVNFNYNLNNEIPLLYGDDIRLKQILYSIINYSFKDRNSKLINLDISGLLRYDICRLIINIKDDGKSLEVDRINEILNYNEELIEKELENINIDIKDIYSIIKILNGNFYIKADKDIGNSYTIIIDYEIVDKLSSNYVDKYFNKKKVLLINDDTEELKKYVSVLKNNDIEVTTSMFGKDSIDRIRNKEKYDLIIIDDEMQPYNAIKTLEELKKIDKFKTKVIIMIGLNKEFIKEHYINDYNFTDFLLKRNYKKELDRIIKKYL